jgi:hypothetical protein
VKILELMKVAWLVVFLLTGLSSAETWFTPPVAERPVDFVSASQWGSSPRDMPLEWRQTPSRIVIHHAGVNWPERADAVQKVRNLQAWGQREKGWPDLPYHFLISPDGRVFEGRDPFYRPQSNTSYDMQGVLNVQLFGNFEEQAVTANQTEALLELLLYLCQRYQVSPARISTHLDEAPGQTTCPGRNLIDRLPAVLGKLRRRHEPLRFR